MAPTSSAPAPVLTNLPPSLPTSNSVVFWTLRSEDPSLVPFPVVERTLSDGRTAAAVHHAVKREEITITLFFSELSGATRTKVKSDWKASLEQRGKKYRARCEAGR